MSGHSKWHNIKNRKGALDAKKSKVFGQLSKLIRIATRDGHSGDPANNPSLRTLLEKARSSNMPKQKVQKAIDQGLGKSQTGHDWQEVGYEGFGPFGEAYLIQVMTDNPNRSGGEIRFALNRVGGSLAGPGSAKYLFDKTADNQYLPKLALELESSQTDQVRQIISTLEEHDEVEEVFCSVRLD